MPLIGVVVCCLCFECFGFIVHGSVWLNRTATTGTKSPPPFASGGLLRKDSWKNQPLTPPCRALAHTAKRTGIDQMPVAVRFVVVEMR